MARSTRRICSALAPFCLSALMSVGAAHAEEARAEMTLALAKKLGAAAEAEAKRLGAPGGAFAVVDDGGHLLYLERLDNTFPAAASVSPAKARTAAEFRMPTADFETAVNGGRYAFLGVREDTAAGRHPAHDRWPGGRRDRRLGRGQRAAGHRARHGRLPHECRDSRRARRRCDAPAFWLAALRRRSRRRR